MRFKEPEPFDPKKEYQIGDKVIFDNKILKAEKWTDVNTRHLPEGFEYKMFCATGKIFTQCGMCDVDNKVCNMQSPCFKYDRKDRKNINFRFWSTLKNKE